MISRRAAMAAALLAALPVGLAGCSSDPNSISAQANRGDDKNYVSGDGTVTATLPGSSGAPFGNTVSLPSTVVVTGVFWSVTAPSSTAVTTFGSTVMVTSAVLHTGTGVDWSHTW